MFEGITKKRKNRFINLFGWTLLTVVCVIFVFIGFSPDSSFLGSTGAAAIVNGDAISVRDYRQALDRMGETGGDNSKEGRQKRQLNAINMLVNEMLIMQEAKKLNIFVSDRAVFERIIELPYFQTDGKFDRLRYKEVLQQNRLTEGDFEQDVRKRLTIQKLVQLVTFAAKDLPVMDEIDKELDQAKVNVSYLSFNDKNTKSVRNFNQQQLDEFAAANEAQIKSNYESNKSSYGEEAKVKARHILIKPKTKDKKGEDEALEKLKKIAADTTPANFADQAKKHSEGPTKTKGGDLGFFGKGRMVKEFDAVAFQLEKGQVSEPVKTQFGWHLIYLEDKKPSSQKSFDEVKTKITRELLAKEKFEKLSERVRGLIKEGKQDELNALATENGWRWRDTGLFSINQDNIPGLGRNKEFLDVAMTLTKDRPFAREFVRSNDNIFILKLKDAQYDKNTKPNPQMDFLKQFMAQQKSNIILNSWTEALRKDATIRTNVP